MTSSTEASCRALSLDRYPAINPLALDLVRGRQSALQFFAPGPRSETTTIDRGPLAESLKKSNHSFGNDVDDLIDAWAGRRGRAVVAGQQVGFGGGPLYTLVKLASLLNLARQQHDERIVPFFWMATEDHDFAEVANLTLLIDGKFRQFGTTATPAERLPVGDLKVPEDLRHAVMEATSLAPEGWLEPSCSFRDSFARLIASITRGRVVLVDSLLPELRRSGGEMFRKAASSLDEIQTVIERRSEEIERAGYRVQVRPPDGDRYTLFYKIGSSGARTLIEKGEELEQLSLRNPEKISTAALMRPLLQDLVFEPEAFVGGPAEVSYYAQLGEAYHLLGISRPRVMLRAHALLVPERFMAAMDRHGIGPEEWLDSPEAILSRREQERETALAERIELLKNYVDGELESIRESILEADRSLTRSLNRTSRRIDYHLDVLGRRGRRVIARSDRERFAAVERLSNTIRPNGVVQDRVVGWLSHWLLWGGRTIESIIPHAEPGTDRLNIIGIS